MSHVHRPAASPPGAGQGSPPVAAGDGRRSSDRFQTFSSLRHRDFLFLWVSNLFNASASWFEQITVPWVVWQISGSPFLVGVAGGARSLPFLFIGPLAGVFADRLNRRKMVIIVQSILAAVVFVFALAVQQGYITGSAGVAYALIFTIIGGALHAVIQPVRQAMVANTVPRQDLFNAIALNSVAGNVARVIGPGVGGVLIAWLGPEINFAIEGVLYVLMALAIVPIKLPYREEITAIKSSVKSNLKQGFTYVASEPLLFHLLLLSYIPAFLVAPVIGIMPVIAVKVLGHGPKVYGFLVLAMGVGGILGTACFATFGRVFQKGQVGMVALLLLSCTAIVLGVSHWLPVSLAAMFFLGLFRIAFQINNNTSLQMNIADGLRGRVMAIYHLDHGFTPFASMLVGAMTQFTSANLTVTVLGAISLALGSYAFFAYKDVRHIGRSFR
ncbi:MAG: MFS transporter [Dehalococcoidia bacterium]|nr:MFS transporter [Dehalococcoidia bacterium]